MFIWRWIIAGVMSGWRYMWSKLRFSGEERRYKKSGGLNTQMFEGISDDELRVKEQLRTMYKAFTYEYDHIDDLGDSMRSPHLSFYRYLTKDFKDDCDGYHAAVMYWVQNVIKDADYVGIYTAITKTIKKSHCVCVYRAKGKVWLADYTRLYSWDENDDCVKDMDSLKKTLNAAMYGENPDKHGTVVYSTFSQWSDKKHRYVYDNGKRMLK